jgi:hypothetical protein
MIATRGMCFLFRIRFFVSMTLTAAEFHDWISLSEHPGYRGLFFLGADDKRITFYAQQVRALRLVHALSREGRLTYPFRIAVVGAGAAGATAALALVALGQRVELFDQATFPISLQQASPRMLHPNIYDWPELGALDPHANLPLMSWESKTGGEVCQELTRAINNRVPFTYGATVDGIAPHDSRWTLSWTQNGQPHAEDFDQIILAVGFGEEQIIDAARTEDYWRTSGVPSAARELGRVEYFLSGSGDGGLTDLLGLLVEGFDHIEFIRWFLAMSPGSELADAVRSAEAATRPNMDLWPAYEAYVESVLHRQGIIRELERKLRRDRRVVFNTEGPALSRGAAATLNQVMVFALMKACEARGEGLIRRSTGHVDSVLRRADGHLDVEGPVPEVGDLAGFKDVWLRHGPDRAARYRPFQIYYDAYKLHRSELVAGRPDLAGPPRLHLETYAFFDPLADAFVDAGRRADLRVAREVRNRTLVIGLDQATGRVYQQGARIAEELAETLGHLPEYSVQLRLVPDALGLARDELLRLSRASAGRIVLTTGPDYLAAWQTIDPAVRCFDADVNMPFARCAAPQASRLALAIDTYLLELLGAAMVEIVASGYCPEIGQVHASIVAAIRPTWIAWQGVFAADTSLRAHFLRLLWRVEQAGLEPWDGDRGALDRLTAALVLMLACGAGVEDLRPSVCSPGNLSFEAAGIALGSGCNRIGMRRVDDCRDPAAWSVDALILSAASELVFDETGGGPLLIDAGAPSSSLMRAARVAPAVIQNRRDWRVFLEIGVEEWREAVRRELDAWRGRQDAQLSRGPT